MYSSMLDVLTSPTNKFNLKYSRTWLRSFVESVDEKRYEKITLSNQCRQTTKSQELDFISSNTKFLPPRYYALPKQDK